MTYSGPQVLGTQGALYHYSVHDMYKHNLKYMVKKENILKISIYSDFSEFLYILQSYEVLKSVCISKQ